MIALLLLIACAPPDVERELEWAEHVKWATVYHVSENKLLSGAEVLLLRKECAQRLRSPYVPCRFYAAKFLKHLGTTAEIPELSRATRDNDDMVSSEACVALASVGDKRVIPTLLAAYLRDGSRTKQASSWASCTWPRELGARNKPKRRCVACWPKRSTRTIKGRCARRLRH